MPDHGFKLLDVENERLKPGEAVECDLGNGLILKAKMTAWLDDSGKVALDVSLDDDGREQFLIAVATPINQLSFLDKKLDGGDRLLIGLGAR